LSICFPLDFRCCCCFSLSLIEEASQLTLLAAVEEALLPLEGTRFPTDGTRFPFPIDEEVEVGFFFPLEAFGIFFPIEGVLFPLPTATRFRFPIDGAIFPADVEADPRFPMEGFCLPGTLFPMLLYPLPL
jgi:hypothetical protein